jgi:type I restriction enzyme S subunit
LFDDFTCDTKFANFPFKVKSSAMKLLRTKNGLPISYAYELLRYINYKPEGHARHWISIMQPLEVWLPQIDEQEKVGEFLSKITEKIDKQKTLIEHLKKYKRGLLDAVFNQKIHVTKDNEEWQECRIGDILKILHGRDYKDYQAPDGEYPVLGTGGIIDHATKYLCDWACVLIGRKGTIDKPQYMDTPFWTVDTLFYSKPEAFHNPKFQYYLFQTINWKKYNEASGVPSQSSSTIEGISVYVPNLKTQETIARLFSNVDELIEKQTSILSQLQESKKGLLQQLFI